MNEFSLSFNLPLFPFEIKYGDDLLFIGSCFSDEIASKAKYVGFKVHTNPFGTVFHPLALGRFIQETLEENVIERPVERKDVWLSWDANSSFHAMSKEQLLEKLSLTRQNWKSKICSAEVLFVTFGTAWGYRNKISGELVANCHKFPSSEFHKELTDQSQIIEQWNAVLRTLQKANPQLKVVFTVSPVRHSKDGLIENNQSKAILIDAVHHLCKNENCFYFPSYEIVIDELRDYRFFKTDRVHPNEEAINYVWKRFSESFFSEHTNRISREVLKLRMAEAHRSLFPESKEYLKHIETSQENRLKLMKDHPEVKLD